jgi:hypothetical protein
MLGMVLGLTAGTPSAALAGGGSWAFGDDPKTHHILVWGEQVHARTSVWVPGIKDAPEGYFAGPEHGPFYGYISPRPAHRIDSFAPPLPKDAMLVGEVTFSETDDPDALNVALDFVVPEIEPGYYTLHHCNDPCTRQIGDLMSTPIVIVAERGDRFLAARADHVDRRFERLRARSNHELDEARARVGSLLARVGGLESDVGSLREEIASLERSSAREQGADAPDTSVLWLLLGLPAGALSWALLRPR